jgi:hypothetical protein
LRGTGAEDPAPDPSQLAQRLLHLRDARLALSRFGPRPASHNSSRSHVERKPELLGETYDFFGAFPRPVELAALEVDKSSKDERVRQTGRMFHALRQRHRLVALGQRPIGMAKAHVTPGRIRVGVDAGIEYHRVC